MPIRELARGGTLPAANGAAAGGFVCVRRARHVSFSHASTNPGAAPDEQRRGGGGRLRDVDGKMMVSSAMLSTPRLYIEMGNGPNGMVTVTASARGEPWKFRPLATQARGEK